ncbi:MAG: hypothetical protein Q4D15_06580, partial [Lachnospiraceae bacterium]|nr:hypothetical protein [Lachnospiraceae bacterium]
MKIQIKQAMTLIENETGGYSAEVRNIFIDGNRIVSLDQAPEGFLADKIIDGTGKFAIPGLINSHTHAYMSLFRNYADD